MNNRLRPNSNLKKFFQNDLTNKPLEVELTHLDRAEWFLSGI